MTTGTKTEKQVVSGYHRPVCLKCHCELHPEKNDVGVLDMAKFGPYQLYSADLWKCPKCGMQVVGGFGFGPIANHFEADFTAMIDGYKKHSLLIENFG